MNRVSLWCGAESNRRHMDFQSIALPTELPHRKTSGKCNKFFLLGEPKIAIIKADKFSLVLADT